VMSQTAVDGGGRPSAIFWRATMRRSHNIGYFRYFLSLFFTNPPEQIFLDCSNPSTRFDPSALLLLLFSVAHDRDVRCLPHT
jgi:hypothetical protein